VVLAVTEQIALIHKWFPMKTQRGTIKEMTVRSLVQSHPRHQIRFNNPARRSDAPTGITETKRKLLENQQPQNENRKRKNKDKMFRKSINKSNFYQCEETNCPTIC
jgi:hypothetical protein